MNPIRLANDHLQISILPRGAELCSLLYAGRQLLWQADPAVWPRHAPILFPIVGRLKHDTLRHQGRDYPLKQHGFARDLDFTLLHHEAHAASLRLCANDATRRHYPFDFELTVHYQLQGKRLHIDYRVSNHGGDILPFSLGAHPAFRWPLQAGAARNAHRIVFEKEEPAPLRRLHDGLLLHEPRPSPVQGKVLTLDDALFHEDALIFDRLGSRQVCYQGPAGPTIRVMFEDFPHLGIWSKPGAGFICIEPWQGHASPEDFEGEFMHKPGVFHLPPYSERIWRHSIEVLHQPA